MPRFGALWVAIFPLAGLASNVVLFKAGLGHFRPLDAWTAGGIYLALIAGFSQRNNTFLLRWTIVVVVSFALILALGTALVVRYSGDFLRDTHFLETLSAAFVGAALIRCRKDFFRFVWACGGAGAVLSIASVVLLLTHTDIERVSGYLSYAGGAGQAGQGLFNGIAAFQALIGAAFVVCFPWFALRSKGRTIFAGLVVLLNIVGVVLAQSRSATLALAIVLLLAAAAELRRLWTRWRGLGAPIRRAVLGIAVLASVAAVYLAVARVNRFNETFQPGSSAYRSEFTRLDLWRRGLDFFSRHPHALMFGMGTSAEEQVLGSPTADNLYMDLVLAYGLAGALLIVIFLLLPATILLRRKRGGFETRVVLVATGVALIVSLTGSVLVGPLYGGATFLFVYGGLASDKKCSQALRSQTEL